MFFITDDMPPWLPSGPRCTTFRMLTSRTDHILPHHRDAMAWPETMWWLGTLALICSFLPPSLHYYRMRRVVSRKKEQVQTNFRPEITIVLPMRDESTNVERKIKEILEMDYPSEKTSIMVIDSCSIDDTAEKARRILESIGGSRKWQVFSMPEPGKSLAVNFALSAIKSEIFVMSDADAHCPRDTLGRLVDVFSDSQVGAVCGRLESQIFSSDSPYRSRFNVIRIGESIIDSTPIFEGSICAFRMSALGGARIDVDVNADDSQLALIARSNGFRAIMDGKIIFSEPGIGMSSRRRVRRAQGVSRVLYRKRGMAFGNEKFGKIMRHNLFLYLIFPWLLLFSSTLIVISLLFVQPLSLENSANMGRITVTIIALLLGMISKTARSLFSGAFSLIFSHILIATDRPLNVWETNRNI